MTMKKTPSKKGGARPGAGRPPKGDVPKRNVSISIDPQVHDDARALGINISETCERALRTAVTRRRK